MPSWHPILNAGFRS